MITIDEFQEIIQDTTIFGIRSEKVNDNIYFYDCYPQISVWLREINGINVIEIHLKGEGMYGTIKVQNFDDFKERLEYYDIKVKFNDKKDEFKYELLDLGLPSGTLWMDRNILADSISDGGKYFGWGEIYGHTKLETELYELHKPHKDNKFYPSLKYNKNDRLTVLDDEDDTAYKYTNGECRMPTEEQIKELIDNTHFSMCLCSDMDCGCFISKINGRHLYIPANGWAYNGKICDKTHYGELWSKSIHWYDFNNALSLGFGYVGNPIVEGRHYRSDGLSVRGVKVKK